MKNSFPPMFVNVVGIVDLSFLMYLPSIIMKKDINNGFELFCCVLMCPLLIQYKFNNNNNNNDLST
jgi:hypothetical protein